MSHIEHLADDYVHKLLAPDDVRRVRQHCKHCADCKAAVRAARRRFAALRNVPTEPAPETLITSTLQRLETHIPLWRRVVRPVAWVGGAAVAASVLLLIGLHIYYLNLAPTPYDLQVLGQTRLLAGSTAALRVRVLNHFRGVGLAGVPVELMLQGRTGSVKLASVTTDADGYAAPRVRIPDWNEDGCQLVVTAQPDGASETTRQTVRVERAWKLMLSSDKPVYQPGQIIRLRVLAMRSYDRKPAADRPTTFTVTDPRGNVIFKRKGTASRYGISSADCLLADEILEGAYTVQCQLDDTVSKLTVEVKRYVLPKFKVSVETDRPYYAPGQTLKATVQGDYFFGKPVAGGSVEAMLRDDYHGLSVGEAKVATDPEGKATIEFLLPDSMKGKASLHVTLTDSAGQQQQRSIERTVAAESLQIDVVPEGGRLVRGVQNRVFFQTTTPDGRPVQARLVVHAAERRQELDTDSTGAATLTLDAIDAPVELRVTASAEGELHGQRTLRLETGVSDSDYLFRADRNALRTGETLTLTVEGSGREPVFFDVLKDGQTILTDVIAVSEGRGEHQLELPAELVGSLELYAYRFVPGGEVVRKHRSLVVRSSDEVRVRANLDRAEYRPGDKARVTLTLSDRKDRPTPGAVSLAAVDEAVFSVVGAASKFGVVEERGDRRELDGAASPHTLSVATFGPKAERVHRTQRDGIEMVRSGYLLLFGLMVATGGLIVYIGLWMYAGRLALAATHLLLLGGLGALLLLSEQNVVSFTAGARMAFDVASTPKFADLTDPESGLAADSRRSPYIRQHFPETLLWRPELVTDDHGRATLDVDLADSITTWRLAASAVTADGRLGTTDAPIRVFQPFFVELNLPTHFTRGDEVNVPVVVYNYLDRPQMVEVKLEDAAWFERLDNPAPKVELAAGEVKSLSYRVRFRTVGRHELHVSALAEGVADAVKRPIDVEPDGRRVDHVFNGTLHQPADIGLSVPDDAVEGSPRAVLKLYPSTFSQLVEGLDAVFQMPYGCFEQTSSTTYPNVLALDYLGRTGRKVPGVEAKARQYIHLGYQRLLGFEVSGGGFDWFGRPPANVTLTAYGLMEFRDMARVHDVDPNLITRTRNWLLSKRAADGSWAAELHGLHDDPTRSKNARLATTAYVAWAVFDGDNANARPTRDWLLNHKPDAIADAHALALVCNALLAVGAADEAKPYLDRLTVLKRFSDGGDQVWWELDEGWRTTFHGSGRGGSVEVTSLAVLALLKANHAPGEASRALTWIARQKDARGTWHSTQATVLALKALLAGTDAVPDGERQIDIAWKGGSRTVVVPVDQFEVMQTVDLSDALASGARQFTLSERGKAAVGYQLAFRYHVPTDKADGASPLFLALDYDRNEVTVGDAVKATARAVNRGKVESPMVVLKLPTPPGFVAVSEDFTKLVEEGTIAKFQAGPRATVVYLRGLDANRPLTLTYRLRAATPGKVTATAGRVYEYYDADRQAHSNPTQLTIVARPPLN